MIISHNRTKLVLDMKESRHKTKYLKLLTNCKLFGFLCCFQVLTHEVRKSTGKSWVQQKVVSATSQFFCPRQVYSSEALQQSLQCMRSYRT